MTYQWKIPMKVPVQTAVAELDRIRGQSEDGTLTPQAVVDASRAEDAPLHSLFEWDDRVAAERYRTVQAQYIIRNITVQEAADDTPVRQFVHAEKGYTTLYAAMSNEELRKALLTNALEELEAFKAKYRALSELAAVFEAMDNISQENIA